MGAEPIPAMLRLDAKPLDRGERRAVSMPALVIRPDGSTADISVLDLSYEGCGVETPVELRAGESIKLSVVRRGAIDARVRWYKDGRAGLVFDSKPTVEKKHPPRRSVRTPLTAEVALRRLGQNSYRVRVNDLSREGCKVELVQRSHVGEHMLIKFEALEVLDAEVCWVENFLAGLRFEKAIHPVVFELLLQRLVK